MCIEYLNRCFHSADDVDCPDRQHKRHETRRELPERASYKNGYTNPPNTTSAEFKTDDGSSDDIHVETRPKKKLAEPGNEGKHESPERAPYENGYTHPPKTTSEEVHTRNPVKTDKGASDGLPSNSPRKDIEGKSESAEEASQETTSKEVRSSPVKTNNSSSNDFPFGSQPYHNKTKFSAKAGDDSEKRMQTKVGHKVIGSHGDFKAKEQTKANDSYGGNYGTMETKSNAKYPF